MTGKQKIVIWGTGNIARQFYYRDGYKYDIQYFIDNNEPKYKINGLRTYYPNEVDLGRYKIIIAMANWQDVADQLEKNWGGGLSFYKNYLPYHLTDKDEIPVMEILRRIPDREDKKRIISEYRQGRKIALINGNCQTSRIKMFLQQNSNFNKEYVFFDMPALYMLSREEIDLLMLNNYILNDVNLFISQNISPDNVFDYRLANNFLLELMDKKVRYICISNLFFDIYFPQGGKEQDPAKEDFIRDMFPYNDAIIDELVGKAGFGGAGYTVEEIISIVCMEDLFTIDFLDWVIQYRLKQLKERESKCDIKMMDYIEENYLKEQLFYSRNHPSNKVLKEESIRILKNINPEWNTEIEHEGTIPSLSINQEFMYPSILEKLRPSFTKRWYSDTISECRYVIEEEIKKYLFCCHKKC